MRRIRAQRPALAWRAGPGGDDLLGRLALLHPVHDGAHHVEAVERALATAAVAHARHQEQPAPARHRRGAVVRLQPLVVLHGVLRGEPWIADAMEEDELAATAVERGEIRPAIGVAGHRAAI